MGSELPLLLTEQVGMGNLPCQHPQHDHHTLALPLSLLCPCMSPGTFEQLALAHACWGLSHEDQ